ncbi:MAG TPA: glycerate kinase [Propionibacteriaceae bacterium]|jgi:glycerate kinase|nr:glycerate kinase [Propionibacteriaceae bacterium]
MTESGHAARVVLAPDKFKGSLTAAEVAAAVAAGLVDVLPQLETIMLPVADGGDGTVAAALSAGFDEIIVDAVGPTGEPVRAPYALHADRAVVELAAVVGLTGLPEGRFDSLGSSTYGLGLVIADAIRRGAATIVLGLGGSASTDGGSGMVQALGARLLDADGNDLPPGGGNLTRLARLDLSPLRDTLGDTTVIVASDVDNPLLGPNGAAAVFGPQKGADPDEVQRLEQSLRQWSQLVSEATGRNDAERAGAGAAGGAGFAALALLNAEIRPGIELILDLIDFDRRVVGADLVVTGEGSLDQQSLAGKAPIGVARAAAGVRVVAVAGRLQLSPQALREAGISAAYALTDLEPDLDRCIAHASSLLHRVGAQIAKEWLD